jgi:hypothetical protein
MAIIESVKSTKGGKRPGAGRPKGSVSAKTLSVRASKEEAREFVRAYITQHLTPLLDAQLQNAQGLRETFVRDEQGRFTLLTDAKQIETALNSGDEGTSYHTFTKSPNVQAFTDLLNRCLDKPGEQQNVVHTGTLTIVHELQERPHTAPQATIAKASTRSLEPAHAHVTEPPQAPDTHVSSIEGELVSSDGGAAK